MKKRKAFLYGFLVMAMIMLLSGLAHSNTVVDKTATVITTVQPPGAFMPTFDLNVIVSLPTSTWYCTINPGYTDQSSANVANTDLIAANADVLSTNYINLSIFRNNFYASSLRQSENTYSVKYRKPRDGLKQSWQA